MYITDDIKYIGVNDRELDLFESQYDVPEGMAYNSYVILDEKIAVFDTVDWNFTDEWLANTEAALGGRAPLHCTEGSSWKHIKLLGVPFAASCEISIEILLSV